MHTYHLMNPYERGEPKGDLKPLQVALKAAKLYNGEIDDEFGPGTADACRRAKYRLGYPIKNVERSGGQTLLNYLTGAWKLPLAFSARRRARGYGISAAEQHRANLVTLMEWAVRNEPAIHYVQARPMDEFFRKQHLPWYTDCSEFTTTLYKWAGVKADPNHNGWNGLGNTDTLLGGITIPLFQALPGDMVIWPPWSPSHHVAMIYKMDVSSDPMICSHGQERGPAFYRLSIETAAQGRPYVVKRYILS